MFTRWFLVGTIAVVGVLHAFALYFHWYFFFWWYDVFMHALGGFAMGILAVLLWRAVLCMRMGTPREQVAFFVFTLGFVALVGIGWEWMEGLCDMFLSQNDTHVVAQLGLVDTMLDLFFDLFGGGIAFFSLTWVRKENCL